MFYRNHSSEASWVPSDTSAHILKFRLGMCALAGLLEGESACVEQEFASQKARHGSVHLKVARNNFFFSASGVPKSVNVEPAVLFLHGQRSPASCVF
jgi:hypothetical protein